MDSKNFESDANTLNTTSLSEPNSFWVDRDELESENNSLQSENLEEQLLSLMVLANSIGANWQENQNLETIDTEISSIDFDDNLSLVQPNNQTNWFEVACQLEEQNQEFSQTIAELEQALTNSQKQLQIQIERSQDAETILVQQSEEIYQTHEQIADLREQLEVSQQEVQRQQSAIATLLKQLDNSEIQVAQLEREYVLVQEDCSERTQKLLAMEKHLRELWSRLHRQQRYTLEYKSALEQFLGIPVEKAIDLELPNPPLATSSIEPWSSQQQYLTTLPEEGNSEIELEFMDLNVDSIAETSPIVRSATIKQIEPSIDSCQRLPSHEISSSSWSRRDRFQDKVDLPSFLRTRHS